MKYLALIFSLFLSIGLFAQNLEIEGKIKISDDAVPAEAGMIRYQAGNFEGYDGTNWVILNGLSSFSELVDADGDTKVELEQNPDEDILRITIDSQEVMVLRENVYSSLMLEIFNEGGNLFIGQNAGQMNQTDTIAFEGINNSFLGYRAGAATTIGDDNTFVGNRAGQSNSSGEDNTFIGKTAGLNNTTGARNTYLGHNAGFDNEQGVDNIFIGDGAGENSSASQSIAIGKDAAQNNVLSRNVAIGYQALQNSDSSSYISAIGYRAGASSTAVADAIYLGSQAGENDSAYHSIMIGTLSGQNNTGESATMVGYITGDENSGDYPTLIGTWAGRSNSGDMCTMVGYNSGHFNYGDHSTLIGKGSGYSNNGEYCTLLGNESGRVNKGDRNTFMGAFSGAGFEGVQNGNNNTFVGYAAGYEYEGGSENSFFGADAGRFVVDGDRNVAIGNRAMRSQEMHHSIAIGFETLIDANPDSSVAIGYRAGAQSDATKDVTYIGHRAGELAGSGSDQTFVGYLAGRNSLGFDCTFVGSKAGLDNSGNNNTFIGTSAGERIKNGTSSIGVSNNTIIGTSAGSNVTTGGNNTYLGHEAGLGLNGGIGGSIGDDNTMVGKSAGVNVLSGIRNSALGVRAGSQVGSGSRNVYLGYESGKNNNGDGNVFIGYMAGENVNGTSNKLMIDNSSTIYPLIEGDFVNNTVEMTANTLTLNGSQEAGSQTTEIVLDGDDGENHNLEFRTNGDYEAGIGWDDGADRLFFYQGGNAMYIRNTRVGVQMEAITNDLEVQGNASKASSGSWLANSDARLKKEIQSLEMDKMLEKVLSMRGVSYEWDDQVTEYERPEGKQYGFVAQDLQKIWPDKVSQDELGYLQTAYGDYDPMIVEAIKALHFKILDLEEMKKENESLKIQNNKLLELTEGLLDKMQSLNTRLSELEANPE